MKSCELHLLDEVNCRFYGLDANTRRQCSQAVKFFDKGAQYSWAVKMGHWDGYHSYFNVASATTFINLLDRLIPVLDKNGYDIEVKDFRDNTVYSFEPVTKDVLSNITWPKGHAREGEQVELQEHQVRGINALLKNPHGLIEAATGFGKTLVCACLAEKALKYGRMIIIVPNVDLVTQTTKVLKQMGIDAGEFYAKKKELDKPVVICTWQSINAFYKKPRGMEQLTEDEIREVLEGVHAIIADEAHGMKAKVIKDLFTNQFKNVPLRWGMTGTIPKDPAEAVLLEINLGKTVLEVHTKELQDAGFLANAEIDIFHLVEKTKFVDHHAELDELISDPERIAYYATLLKSIVETGNTLVIFNRRITGEMLMNEFEGSDIDVDYVHGGIDPKTRGERYAHVQKNDNTLTFATAGVAAVGIDIQRLHNLVTIEIGKSFVRVMQTLGRGLRKGSDKDMIHVYDICWTTKYSNRHKNERIAHYKEKQQKHTLHKIEDWRSFS